MCKEHSSSCPHLPFCVRRFQRISSITDNESTISNRIADCMMEFCYSEKNRECERYKSLQEKLPSPNDLLPDGTRIKFHEFMPVEHYKMK